MPRPKDYGTAVEVHDDGVMELKNNSLVLPPQPEAMRWLALLQFSILTAGTAMSVGTHTVIIQEYRKFFELSIMQIDFLNTVFLGSYLVIGGIVMRIFTRYGLKGGMYTASALFLGGSALKVLAVYYRHFWVIVLAQFMTAFAINFAMAGPSLLSATWFPDTERTLATTIASQADNIGIAMSMLFPTAFIDKRNQGPDDFLIVHGGIFVLALIDSFLTFCVIPKAPKVPLAVQAVDPDAPQSHIAPDGHVMTAEEETKEAMHPTLMGMFRSVSHSTPYVLLSLATAAAISVYWTYSAIFTQILVPYGITEAQSGTLGAIKILASVIPAMMVAKWVDRHRVYKMPLFIAMFVGIACYVGVAWALEDLESPWMPVLLLHLPMGVAQSVMMPIALEYMVEITFPVDPSVSAGVFMYALRILCTIIVTAAPYFLPVKATSHQALVVLFIYAVLSAVGLVLLVFVSSPLRRYMAEHGKLIDEDVVIDAVRHHHSDDADRDERRRLSATQP